MLNDKGSIEVPEWMLTIYGATNDNDDSDTYDSEFHYRSDFNYKHLIKTQRLTEQQRNQSQCG